MKRYICIAKVDDQHFVKYRLNDLLKFTAFLDERWKGWRWFNVYNKQTKEQIANFTNKRRPTTGIIQQ